MKNENTYSDEEIRILKESPYLERVSDKQLTYGRVFYKELDRLCKQGYTAKESMKILGIPESLLTSNRVRKIKAACKKFMEELVEEDPNKTISREMAELRAENTFLKQEAEFLKKKRDIMNSVTKKKH